MVGIANAASAAVAARNALSSAFVSSVPCAFVLEHNPKPNDNSLRFETWPGEINEAYAVNPYDEIAQRRMPQPGFVTYRGGNWAAFSVTLQFRAGVSRVDIVTAGTADIEGLSIAMERKVRWCQALTFPMERNATAFNRRVQRRSSGATKGSGLSALSKSTKGQLKRNDPPMLFVVFGSFMTLRCYVTNVNITWKGPWHPISARPQGAEVQLTFQRLDLGYPNWDSVRKQGGRFPNAPNIPRIEGFSLFNSQF